MISSGFEVGTFEGQELSTEDLSQLWKTLIVMLSSATLRLVCKAEFSKM